MVRPNNEDDGSLRRPRDLPRAAGADLAEEDGDDDSPHVRDDIVDEVAAERAASVEEHCDVSNDEAGDDAERRGDEEAQAAECGRDEEEETLEQRAQVRVRLRERRSSRGRVAGRRGGRWLCGRGRLAVGLPALWYWADGANLRQVAEVRLFRKSRSGIGRDGGELWHRRARSLCGSLRGYRRVFWRKGEPQRRARRRERRSRVGRSGVDVVG